MNRRGSIYILVMIIAVILTTIGLGSIAVERLRHQSAQITTDMAEAKIIAGAGIEHALATINAAIQTDKSLGGIQTWRDLLKNYEHTQSFDRGEFTWDIANTHNNDFSTDSGKPVRVKCIATVGQARYGLAVTLQTAGPPAAALSRALHAIGMVTIGLDTVVVSDQDIGCNDTFRNLGGVVHPDVTSGNTIEGGTYLGTPTPFAALIGMDDVDFGIFDYYMDVGTPIDIAQLPASGTGGARKMNGVALGPTVNPFGIDTNPEGIYVIDCGHQTIELNDMRIFGTLVLKNPGPDSAITGSMLVEPAVANFPSLMVDGSITIGLSNVDLSESAIGMNLNPPTLPYRGAENSDQNDVYPSVIRGIVYVDDSLHFGRTYNRIEGMVIVGDDITTASSTVIDLTYQPQLTLTPPPGFFEPDGQLVLWPITWTRVIE